MSDADLQLLARYTRDRAEDAFSEIVRRHLNLVHSAALRQVRSSQLAEEVAQSVFTDLARNAHHLAPDTILAAWLYQVTRRAAIDVVRREARRQLREQIATEMNAMNATTADWAHIEPLLDEAMAALDDTDRAAVLLRYFENKSLREVGQTLGTSDDAAQKRVSRAVERLREYFAKHGITVGADGLVVVISANAVQAAPMGLAVTISTAAILAGTTLATTATITATKAIAMTALQKTLAATTIAVVVGTGIYEARQASTLQTQVQTLKNGADRLQLAQVTRERDDLTNQLALVRAENARLREDRAELPRLRAEVSRWRTAAGSAAKGGNSSGTRNSGVEQTTDANTDRDKQLREMAVNEKLNRLKAKLSLTSEQENAIRNLFTIQLSKEQAMTETFEKSPPDSPGLSEFIQWRGRAEDEINNLLTSEQQSDYRLLKQEEWAASARASANAELIRLQNMFGLTQEQQDSIFPVLYQQVLNEKMQMEGGYALTSDSQEPIPRSRTEMMQQRAQQRLKALETLLTSQQFQKYREMLAVQMGQAMRVR